VATAFPPLFSPPFFFLFLNLPPLGHHSQVATNQEEQDEKADGEKKAKIL